MRVSEIMHKGCQYLASSDKVAQAAQIMANHDLGVVPIAENEKLVGMVTDRDIVVRGIAQGRDLNSATVGDLMTDEVYYCYDDQECQEVAHNMSEMQIRRMPVVNREKELVGIVSLGDLATRGPQAAATDALQGVSEPG